MFWIGEEFFPFEFFDDVKHFLLSEAYFFFDVFEEFFYFLKTWEYYLSNEVLSVVYLEEGVDIAAVFQDVDELSSFFPGSG